MYLYIFIQNVRIISLLNNISRVFITMSSFWENPTEETQEVNDPAEENPNAIAEYVDEVKSAETAVDRFWPNVMEEIRSSKKANSNTKLPLARIKRIMKQDDNVKKVATETTMLLSKAVEMFINELTLRSVVHQTESGRQTLQRRDITKASANYDQFDFLIDILPRAKVPRLCADVLADVSTGLDVENVNYYLKLAQQQEEPKEQQQTACGTGQIIQIKQSVNSQIQPDFNQI